jgi:hypothetical protein
MHRLSLDPAKSREIMRFTERQIIPKLQQLPGFRRYTALADMPAGRGITFTEWDTREQAQMQLTKLNVGQETADLGIEIDTIEVFQVVAEA